MDQKLVKRISELKGELNTLKIDNVMGRLKNFNQIKAKRKEIARIYTQLNQGSVPAEEVKRAKDTKKVDSIKPKPEEKTEDKKQEEAK